MIKARHIEISGRVQGVGFRPHVYRLAHSLRLTGTVRNGAGKVHVHVEGSASAIQMFLSQVISAAPPLAKPFLGATEDIQPAGMTKFVILGSEAGELADIHIPPDMFTCDDCLAEMNDPGERRYRYPFINCTQCGPRYTIITSMPYDRPNTSLTEFPLCAECEAEYENPLDRRFHAQPLACAACGPSLTFVEGGEILTGNENSLSAAIATLHAGKIIAVKGVGGYHLMCDAASDHCVSALRQRKCRPDKPLAVMFPIIGEEGLASVLEQTVPTDIEKELITSPERPIVLVAKHQQSTLSAMLAPGFGELGVFLPYSPLHHLLLKEFGHPLVATSGNISGEPVLTEPAQVEARLGLVADAFLHHDRPIIRPADDSVFRVIDATPRPIRIGRGKAPLELDLPHKLLRPLIATGGHMKNTVALAWDNRIVLSPHIGELESPVALDAFVRTIGELQELYDVKAETIVCDAHPEYASTKWALKQALPTVKVQHHRAHASALASEYPEIRRWLVFTWDGVGMGDDGSLWGGEGFVGAPGDWHRATSWRPFHLMGGDRAGHEPWRSAAALHWACGQEWQRLDDDSGIARQAWERGLNVHETSAVGRLFDAAACIISGIEETSYEGQGPMYLESLARRADGDAMSLPLELDTNQILRSDWEPLLSMMGDGSLSVEERASAFHSSIAQALVDQACAVSQMHAFDGVGLVGGVFQNRVLCEQVIAGLQEAGKRAFLPQSLPANDGGLALGQTIEALHLQSIEEMS